MIDAYIANLEAKGITDARAIYEEMVATIAQYDAK